jgi:alpha-tubulin suppressor-like RCC1 family protein
VDFFQTKPVKKIACGRTYSVAVTKKGRLYFWGDDGTRRSNTPQKIKTDSPHVMDVTCLEKHLVFSTPDKKIFMVEINAEPEKRIPIPVRIKFKPRTLASTSQRVFVVSESTRLFFFSPPDVKIRSLGTDYVDLVCGSEHVLLLDKKGEVWGFGSNIDKQLGNNAFHTDWPKIHVVHVPFPRTVKKIAQIGAGRKFSFAITSEGKLYFWGSSSIFGNTKYDRALPFCGDFVFQSTTVCRPGKSQGRQGRQGRPVRGGQG